MKDFSDKCFITLTCAEEIREQFYADLDTEPRDTPATDKFVILGDFNTRVGRDVEQRRGVIWKHGVMETNSTGLLLLSKCADHNLLITNTIFHLADNYKDIMDTAAFKTVASH